MLKLGQHTEYGSCIYGLKHVVLNHYLVFTLYIYFFLILFTLHLVIYYIINYDINWCMNFSKIVQSKVN